LFCEHVTNIIEDFEKKLRTYLEKSKQILQKFKRISEIILAKFYEIFFQNSMKNLA
jgi:hypothetical protein